MNFVVEIAEPLQKEHQTNLRTLYTPIIGKNALILYEVLSDFVLIINRYENFATFDELATISSLSKPEIDIALVRLEATGLLRTYISSDESTYVFSLRLPSGPEKFAANPILKAEFIKNAGELLFEKVVFVNKIKTYDKSEFKERVSNFFDTFNSTSALVELNKEVNTLEIPTNITMDPEKALKTLPSYKYVHYLTGNKAGASLIEVINQMSTIYSMSSHSINLIIKYTFDINNNNTVVASFVSKIAKDFYNRQIVTPALINKELLNALKSKTGQVNVKNDKASSQQKINISKVTSTVEEDETSWEQLLGGDNE